jgi:hypothetical protein
VAPGIKTKICCQVAEKSAGLKNSTAKKKKPVDLEAKMAPDDDSSTNSSTGSHSSNSSVSSGASTISSRRSKKSRSSRASRRSERSHSKKKADGKKVSKNKIPHQKATPAKKETTFEIVSPPLAEFAQMTVGAGSPYKPRAIFGGWGGAVPSPKQMEKQIAYVPSDEFLIPSQDNCWGLSFIRPSRGTRVAPILQQVDLKMPERNGIFDITVVENMERDEFERTGVHIRLSIDDNDQGKWSARMPRSAEYPPEFKGRVVIIQGPSISFWLSMTGVYHELLNCPATKKAHEHHDKLRGDDEARKDLYHALVFPPGVFLDNQILSSHEKKLKQNINLLDLTKTDPKNDAGADIEGMTIYWEISFAGGREIGEQKKEHTQSDIRAQKKAARTALKSRR